MNIKKAKEVLERFKKNGLISLSTWNFVALIIDALESPAEIIDYRNVVPKYIHDADCSFLRTQIRDKEKQIEFRDKQIEILTKKCLTTDLSNPNISYCHFCHGTGMRDKNNQPIVYGRDIKNIMEIITYAYQHGYTDK